MNSDLLNEQLANFAEGFPEDSNIVEDIIFPPLLVMYYINYCISYTNMGSTTFLRSYGRTHKTEIFMVYLPEKYLKDSLYCVLSSQSVIVSVCQGVSGLHFLQVYQTNVTKR